MSMTRRDTIAEAILASRVLFHRYLVGFDDSNQFYMKNGTYENSSTQLSSSINGTLDLITINLTVQAGSKIREELVVLEE